MVSTVIFEGYEESLVRDLVESGLYASTAEVIQRGQQLLTAQGKEREAKLARLRRDIEEGLSSGPSKPLDMAAIRTAVRTIRTSRQSSP